VLLFDRGAETLIGAAVAIVLIVLGRGTAARRRTA
jgi:hypothetical protein